MDISFLRSVLLQNYTYCGLLGSLLVIAGILIPMPLYRGRNRESYSILNHFISELGEVGVSKAATIFNVCLFLAGACFIPFVIGLGITLDNFWAKPGILAGIWTAISCMLIGLYPMDKLERHIRVALAFFYGGLFTIVFFTIGIWAQSAAKEMVPRSINIVGIFSIIAYSLFLVFGTRPPPGVKITDLLQPDLLNNRPKAWIIPILEWLVLIFTILWFLIIPLSIHSG
jgi:hypothetical protein